MGPSAIFIFMLFLAMGQTTAWSVILLSESFAYPAGPLVVNSSGRWATHSGTSNEVTVSDEKIRLSGSATEDVNVSLPAGALPAELYARFKVKVLSLPSPGGSYFAHFKDSGTTFRARVWALTSGAAAGSFRFGLSSVSASSPIVLERDLSTNAEYLVVLELVLTNSLATLWINPASERDASVSSDIGSAANMKAFAFRQSSGIGQMQIDDLVIATSFEEAKAGPAPGGILRLIAEYAPPNFIITWKTSEGASYSVWASERAGDNFQLIATTLQGGRFVDSVNLSGNRFYEVRSP